MLVSEFAAGAILWIVRAVIVIAAVFIGGGLAMRADRTEKKAYSRLAGAVLIAGLIALFFSGKFAGGTPVLFARAGAGDVSRTDQRLYGSADHRFADGRTHALRGGGARQLVVNDTPIPLYVASIVYGTSRPRPEDLRIEPYTVAGLPAVIDHFGDGDQAPYRSDKEVRLRLRWERAMLP